MTSGGGGAATFLPRAETQADPLTDAGLGSFEVPDGPLPEGGLPGGVVGDMAERFRLLAQHSADFIFRYSLSAGRFEYASPSSLSLTGWAPEELYDNPRLVVDMVEPVALQAIREARVAGDLDDQHFEFQLRRKDGSRLWVSASLTIVHGERGEQVAVEAIVRDIATTKAYEEEISRWTLSDPLTGLANRALLVDRLGQALARSGGHGSWVGVFFVDLDRFKLVNDGYGHEVGDALLREVAARLVVMVRQSDTVARFGGDELVVVAEGFTNPASLLAYGEALRSTLEAPIGLDAVELAVTARVGVTVGRADDDPRALIADADAAVGSAKTRGGACVELFDPSMRTVAEASLELDTELRRALERDELVLHYQPMVSLSSGRALGVEALVRWQHPTKGLLPPASFVPRAEETGLIVPLGVWVLEEACRQVRSWSDRGLSDLRLTVNLSARQLAWPDLVERVASILDGSGLSPERLTFEITETAVLADVESLIAVMKKLTTLGITFALDDFGTGYSSLSYLKRLPVRVVKVDRSMVDGLDEDPHDSAIVTAIMGMARALDLRVVAEGVETRAQAAALRRLGCEFVQGFLFSRPLPPSDVLPLLESSAGFDPGGVGRP